MGLLSVPLKTVLLYYATQQNESVPESYAVCDGTTLTSTQQDINPGSTFTLPDLRNRFVLGADITKAIAATGGTTNASTDAPGPGGSGGSHSKALVVAELAAHSHTGSVTSAGAHTHAGSSAASNGDHTHTASTSTTGAHTHTGSSTSTTGEHTHAGSTGSGTAASGGSHTHSISDPGHVHTFTGSIAPPAGQSIVGAPQSTSATFNAASQPVMQSATTGITVVSGGAHTHSVSASLTLTSDGNHSHALTIASDGSHSHTVTVGTAGAHTHTLTITSDGVHTHTFTGDSTGSGQAWDTRPRYFGLVYIMKVKI